MSWPDLVTYLARRRLDQLSAHSEALGRGRAHEVIVVDDRSALHEQLIQYFAEKYDAQAAAFVELRPPTVLVTE